jgi:hypothetical protein
MRYLRPILIVIVLLIILFLVVSVSGDYVEAPTLLDRNTTTTFPTATTSSGHTLGRNSIQYADGDVVVTDEFALGIHTYSFYFYLPTPCHQLTEPDVLIRESYPEQIVIAYTLVPPASDMLCAQVIVRTPVVVRAKASEGAVLASITLDGVPLAFILNRSDQ